MATIDEALTLAIRHHQAGEAGPAEQLYRQILRADPRHANALYLLGLLALQAGKPEQGAACMSQAIAIEPAHWPYHFNLGLAYQALGRLQEASACYRQVLVLKPDHAEALNNLGNALLDQGQVEEAMACCRQALALRPHFLEAFNNLGNALQKHNQLDEAIACYRQALALSPNHPEVHNNLGSALHKCGKVDEAIACYRQTLRFKPHHAEAHNNLGKALLEQEKVDEAIACCRQALALRPGFVEAHNNLGNAYLEQRKLVEAIACYQQALRLDPGHADARTNLGSALQKQGKLEEAIACYRQALVRKPDHAAAHNSLGTAFREQGKLAEAVACHRQALHLQPDFAEVYNNLGVALAEQGKLDEAMVCAEEFLRRRPDYADGYFVRALLLLMQGDYDRGWKEYEWRWRTRQVSAPTFSQPRWDGSDLKGKTILLHAEQGLGDTVQFIRYAPLVKQRGGRVIVACQERLCSLLSTCAGIDQLIAQGTPAPPFDVEAPLLSLPAILGTTLKTVPAPVSYLRANPERIEIWRERLASKPGFKVGINWRGRATNPMERYRGMALEYFAALAQVDGVRLISLQRGPGTEEVPQVAHRFRVEEPGPGLDEGSGPFQDTAAIMKNLDLVITSDTVIPHVAGALGVPVWVALPYAADWRWLVGREDCPWYPTMRLFRQSEPGQWQDVFQRMADELRQKVTATARPDGG